MTVRDDFDSRAESATSLARTFVGLYLRRLGGWISIADLIRVLDGLGIETAVARTTVARLKARGLLVPERRGSLKGYRLSEDAVQMLEAGDRRIFHPRRMTDDDAWCLISFSIPEQQRALRHQLRRRLHWIGGGIVSSALWICPAFLADEVEVILDDLRLRPHATVFVVRSFAAAGSPEAVARSWWDLDALARLHEDFLERTEPLLSGAGETLGRYLTGMDLWRPIPYLDPGLPPRMLPPDWPGHRSEERYRALAELADPAWTELRARVS